MLNLKLKSKLQFFFFFNISESILEICNHFLTLFPNNNFSEAVETRHALHGVQWPSSNPKCLNVDFGSESQMERAIASTNEDAKPAINLRDDRSLHPWDRNEAEREKVNTSKYYAFVY